MTLRDTGSVELDRILAERARIRAAWQAPPKAAKPPAAVLVFPPLPQQNIKSVEERLAEAEAFRGVLPDKVVNDIRIVILRSARDFKEDGARVQKRPTIGRIKRLVAEHFSITVEQVMIAKTYNLVLARQIAMYLATKTTRRSNEDIAWLFGGRDHTTVTKSVQKIERMMAADMAFATEISMLARMLES